MKAKLSSREIVIQVAFTLAIEGLYFDKSQMMLDYYYGGYKKTMI